MRRGAHRLHSGDLQVDRPPNVKRHSPVAVARTSWSCTPGWVRRKRQMAWLLPIRPRRRFAKIARAAALESRTFPLVGAASAARPSADGRGANGTRRTDSFPIAEADRMLNGACSAVENPKRRQRSTLHATVQRRHGSPERRTRPGAGPVAYGLPKRAPRGDYRPLTAGPKRGPTGQQKSTRRARRACERATRAGLEDRRSRGAVHAG